MNRFKTLLLSLLLAELLFSYAPAFAQTPSPTYSGVESSITTYLCNPLAGGNGVLYQCINQIYKFAIIVASVMGVFFIVIAGYVYMSAEGNSESTTKAKDILTTTITALVILFAGYALLYTINPDLVQFHGNTLQPVNIAAPTVTTTGNAPSGQCIGCVNLASNGIPTQNSTIQATPAVLSKLQALKSQPSLSGVSWAVSSAYDYRPTPTDCHNTGACADLVVKPDNVSNWSSLCQAITAVGFSKVLNEAITAPNCPTNITYDTTDGHNIHVQP
jgi:hypothetical protein